MKKTWNSLIQRWSYELEPCDIACLPDTPIDSKTLVLVISTPDQDTPHRVDVQWN